MKYVFHQMKDMILLFDIPREERRIELKIWRELKRLDAKMIQHSVWKSDKLQDLIDIATFIKKSGGSATILEEKLIF